MHAAFDHRALPPAAIAAAPLDCGLGPERSLAAMGGGAAFLLESAGPGRGHARWSILGSHPFARFVGHRGKNRFHWMSRGLGWSWDEEPLPALRRVMRTFPAPSLPGGAPFAGGAVGVLAYELGRRLLPVPPLAQDDLDLPELSFFLYDRFLLFDRLGGGAEAVALAWDADRRVAEVEALARAELLAEEVRRRAQEALDAPAPAEVGREMRVEALLPADAYRRAVDRCVELIHQGEAYELCLTGRFQAPFAGDPLALYRELRLRNPAPFAAFLRMPEASLISSSPERFLKLDANGRVEARPIKGTRPRGGDPAEDAALRAELAASRKDRAENVMIVDLLRNDLSRVCESGSVEVPELCVIEDYASVFQMVSTITGHLAPGRDLCDLLTSAFPGGPMTGAPKIAAMRIFESLEPRVRGYYSGALGMLSFDGAADLSMVIRGVLLKNGRARVGAGGAVVARSDADAEWREAQQKARKPLEAVAAVQGFALPEEWD